jgi:hypothetical protein
MALGEVKKIFVFLMVVCGRQGQVSFLLQLTNHNDRGGKEICDCRTQSFAFLMHEN